MVGTSGSGKTTFSRDAAHRLGVPHLELDSLHHQPDWVPAPVEQFRAGLGAFLDSSDAADGWVVDGNYATRCVGMLDEADTVVWLDYSRAVVMGRVVRRTLGRGLLRRELWNGNRERLSRMFARDPERNIVLWAWTTHARNAARLGEAASAAVARRAQGEGSAGVRWVRLTGPRAARRWLDDLGRS